MKNKLENSITQVCSTCKIVKQLSEFYVSSKTKLGVGTRCKPCHNVYNRNWQKINPNKMRSYLLSKMGLTIDEYNLMVAQQDGRCAACGEPETAVNSNTGEIKRLAIDHDHSCCPSSKACKSCIRGLLCQSCNCALGLLNDDLERIASLVKYLEKNKLSC